MMENRSKQDGIRSQCQLVQQYETDGNKNVRIKSLKISSLPFFTGTIEVVW
jgi:hypothetical protein